MYGANRHEHDFLMQLIDSLVYGYPKDMSPYPPQAIEYTLRRLLQKGLLKLPTSGEFTGSDGRRMTYRVGLPKYGRSPAADALDDISKLLSESNALMADLPWREGGGKVENKPFKHNTEFKTL